MREIELFLDENGEWLEKISLVDEPAIETDFLCFSKEAVMRFSADEERHIITGPVMVPEKRILRLDEAGREYYVYFSAETVEKAAHRWLQENMNHQFNLEHRRPTGSVDVIESWVVEDPKNDKAASLGFSLPRGTWMMSCKVNDEELWSRIKAGEFNGFSVEGTFLMDDEKAAIIAEAEEFLRTAGNAF